MRQTLQNSKNMYTFWFAYQIDNFWLITPQNELLYKQYSNVRCTMGLSGLRLDYDSVLGLLYIFFAVQ